MGLSLKQKRFCEEYAISGNATEAAKKAGYSEKTAYSIGQRLLKNVEIKKYLSSLTNKESEKRIATVDEILEFLTSTFRCEECSWRDRIKAAELLGKRYALFTDNGNGGNENITVNVNLTDYGREDDDNS